MFSSKAVSRITLYFIQESEESSSYDELSSEFVHEFGSVPSQKPTDIYGFDLLHVFRQTFTSY
jgi:hypothetical protein